MHIEILIASASGGLRPPRPPTGASPLDPTGGLQSPRPPAQDAPHILYQVYAPVNKTCSAALEIIGEWKTIKLIMFTRYSLMPDEFNKISSLIACL